MTLSVPDISVAFLGERGSGKTTLLTRYNNFALSLANQQYLYKVSASDNEEAKALLLRQGQMKQGNFPDPTTQHRRYHFHIRTSSTAPLLAQLIWYDYPGGWWNSSGLEDEKVRAELFRTFLNVDVGILLLDATQLILSHSTGLSQLFGSILRVARRIETYKINGITISANYVRQTLSIFANELSKLTIDNGVDTRSPFPSVWIIALSKSDIIEEMIQHNIFTAEHFATSVLNTAETHVNSLQNLLGDEFGKTFLLLSTCRGGGRGHTRRVESYKETIGLELIAPLAFELKLLSVFREIRQSLTGKLLLALEPHLRSAANSRWDIGNFFDWLYGLVSMSPKVTTAKQIAELLTLCFRRVLENEEAALWYCRVGDTIQQKMLDELSTDLNRMVNDGAELS